MKRVLWLIPFWLLALPAQTALQPGDRVAVCGDSITEQKLYSVFIEDYLLLCQPVAGLRANQFGWGGETSWGFAGRMANDTLSFKPQVATTCYGMNDGGYSPMTPDKARNYRQSQKRIVDAFKKGGVRVIVVGSPGVVDSQTFRGNPELATMYNKTLAEERDISQEVAKAEGVLFANVFDPMMDVMVKAKAKYGKAYPLAGNDGVHPGPNGHLVMAYAFLKALGCDGNLGTISIDLAANKADAKDGHKVLSFANGAAEIESSRYPFCTFGDPASPNATRGVLEFLPFNAELNRLQFVVTGAKTAKLRVTWGTTSKEFAAEALAKGINLADEFPDNPFGEPFRQAEQKIRVQQNLETPAIKQCLNGLPAWRSVLADDKAVIDGLADKLLAKLVANSDTVAKGIPPVKHTIKIEAVP